MTTVAHLLPDFWSVGAATGGLGGARLSWRRGPEDEPPATSRHLVEDPCARPGFVPTGTLRTATLPHS